MIEVPDLQKFAEGLGAFIYGLLPELEPEKLNATARRFVQTMNVNINLGDEQVATSFYLHVANGYIQAERESQQ